MRTVFLTHFPSLSQPLTALSSLSSISSRWLPFDPSRNFPDLGRRFIRGERLLREALLASKSLPAAGSDDGEADGPVETANGADKKVAAAKPRAWDDDILEEDERDISWSAVIKRTFEAYVRGEAPNAYGEWIGDA